MSTAPFIRSIFKATSHILTNTIKTISGGLLSVDTNRIVDVVDGIDDQDAVTMKQLDGVKYGWWKILFAGGEGGPSADIQVIKEHTITFVDSETVQFTITAVSESSTTIQLTGVVTNLDDVWEAINLRLLIPNPLITPGTFTKLTIDANGLVTVGASATTADINSSSGRRYVTDEQLVVIQNTSGINSGDDAINDRYEDLGSFPGMGTTHILAAYGDHSHIGVYVPVDGVKVLSDVNYSTVDKAKVDSLEKSNYYIILPSSGTVAGRCVTPTYVPTGWTVAAGANPNDLVITHNLTRYFSYVTVVSIDGGGVGSLERENAAFAGLEETSTSILTILGFCTRPAIVRINLIFN
jgi:hypothetical protein